MLFSGYFEAEYDPLWDDKAEVLPGENVIERGQIQRAVRGECFWVYDDDGGQEWIESTDWGVFVQYYRLWDDFRHLHALPMGPALNDNPRWVTDAIKTIEKAWTSTENWRAKKAIEDRERERREAEAGRRRTE